MKSRSEIKIEAKKILSANYGQVLGRMLLVGLLSSLAGATLVGSIIVGPPLVVGLLEGIKLLWRGQKTENIFSGFEQDKFGRSIGAIVLMYVFIVLWSMLFFIPGIIMSLAYCLTPFIISDSKGLTAGQAIGLSKKITKGCKGKIFVFYLSYFGWFLLSGLTAGILGIFYVAPYMLTAFGGYYEELKNNAIRNGVVSISDFGYSDADNA